MKEIDDSQFGGPLPITHVMWYFDTHLHHRKQQQGFTASFTFIDHRPDMACKIASIEPDARMYLLGVSADRAADWDHRVQRQLNHVLTHGGRLDDSGDWDQQANWTNRGIPLWVRDDKYGEAVSDVKEEELEEKGQAEAAQAPAAKRKSAGQDPAPKKKKTASKPQPQKLSPLEILTGAMKRRRMKRKRTRK